MGKLLKLLAATLLFSVPMIAVVDDDLLDMAAVKALINQQAIPSDGDYFVAENVKEDYPVFTEGAYRDNAHADKRLTAVHAANDIGFWDLSV